MNILLTKSLLCHDECGCCLFKSHSAQIRQIECMCWIVQVHLESIDCESAIEKFSFKVYTAESELFRHGIIVD